MPHCLNGAFCRQGHHSKFLSLKELHRLPPPPQSQTSPQARYLTAHTTAAQRLRALGRIADRQIFCLKQTG